MTFPRATGDGTLTYSLAPEEGATLPAGLTFNATTRTLSGVPSRLQATTGVRYTVTDGDGDQAHIFIIVTVLDGVTQHPLVDDIMIVGWTPSEESGVTGYLIQWKTGDQTYSTTQRSHTAGPTDFTHQVGDLALGVYMVRVTQQGGPGNGTSAEHTVTLHGWPGVVFVDPVAGDARAIDVEWETVSTAAGYVIEWKLPSDTSYPLLNRASVAVADLTYRTYTDGRGDTVRNPTHRVTGLEPNTKYEARVTVYTAAGTAHRPDGLSHDNVGTTHGELTGLTVVAVDGDGTKLDVTWQAPDTSVARFKVRGYRVQWKTAGAQDYPKANVATVSTGTSHRIDGLTAGTTYAVRVTVLGNWSGIHEDGDAAEANGTTGQATGGAGGASGGQANELAGLTVNPVAGNTTELAVSWNTVNDAEQYLVQWKTGSDPYNSGEETTDANHTITALSADTAYTVQVTAIDTAADPDAELAVGEASGATLDAMGTVTVSAVADSSDSLDVSWPTVNGAVGYVVEYKTGNGSWTAVTRADATAITERITGLTAETAYTVRVTARHTIGGVAADGDSAEGSGTTNAAEPDNTPASGAPTISGTAQVGEALTADTSGISDADGLDNATFTYQWMADGSDISAATGSGYTPVAGDVGKALSVRVSFTDDAGNAETLTSAATAAVVAEDPPEDDSAASFVIYHDPEAGDDAVDRYNQGVKLLKDASLSYTEVVGDVQDDVDRLAGVTGSVLPRFFLGDPTAEGWVSKPKENNGGLRWLKGKVAELSGG